jgi:hypothetical protein
VDKRSLTGLILVLLFILGSCNPFTTNLYSSFDVFENPDLTDANAVLEASDEPQFYENLANDPEAKAQVLETLAEVYNDPDASDEKQQEAALMSADVYLKTSDTQAVMSNLNSLVSDAVSGEDVFSGESESDGPEVFYRSIFGEPPTDVAKASYKAAVIIRLTAFRDSAVPLQVYGEKLEETNSSPPDTNDGDNATKALMAGMTRTLLYYIDESTAEDKLDILAEYLSTPEDSDGNVLPAITYVGGMPEYDGPNDMLLDPDDPTNPAKDGLQTVVSFGGLDLDSFFE